MATIKTSTQKPDIRGLNSGQNIQSKKRYYNENKDQILADFENLGATEMLKKWGMSKNGWTVIRARWLPDRFDYPPWYDSKTKTPKIKIMDANPLDTVITSPEKLDHTFKYQTDSEYYAKLEIENSELRGWQACAREFFNMLKGKTI